MTTKTTLSLTLLVSLSSACGLIKVNGKPLGGGASPGSTSSASTTSSEAEPAAQGDNRGFESGADIDARRKREYEQQERESAAEKAGQPEICGQYGISDSRDIKLENFADIEQPNHDMGLDAREFAEVMCSTRGKHLELRPQVMALRTKWMKSHGLDENDFLVVLVERMGRGWPSQSYKDFPGPISQIEKAGSNGGRSVLDELGSRASMLARVSYVERCLRTADGGRKVLHTILCTTEPLDTAKALAEIEATPDVNVQTRFHLRKTVHDTVNDQAVARSELAKLAKDEPGITKLIAIAESQRKEWSAPSPPRAKLIQLVETMEAATAVKKRSAFAGCEVTTRAAWSEIVKAAELPAVAENEVLATMIAAVFKSPEAYLAYRALSLCADGVDAKFFPHFDILGAVYLRRGARSSTIAAWMAAAGDIKFDSKELKMGDLLRDLGAGGGSRFARVSVGTIDKVAAKDAMVEISFKKDIIQYQDCIDWKPTGRIRKVESSGAVSYEQVCTKNGMVKYDRKPDDVSLSELVAQGLKPGMLFMVTQDPVDPFPIVATASSKSTKAAWLFDVSLGK